MFTKLISMDNGKNKKVREEIIDMLFPGLRELVFGAAVDMDALLAYGRSASNWSVRSIIIPFLDRDALFTYIRHYRTAWGERDIAASLTEEFELDIEALPDDSKEFLHKLSVWKQEHRRSLEKKARQLMDDRGGDHEFEKEIIARAVRLGLSSAELFQLGKNFFFLDSRKELLGHLDAQHLIAYFHSGAEPEECIGSGRDTLEDQALMHALELRMTSEELVALCSQFKTWPATIRAVYHMEFPALISYTEYYQTLGSAKDEFEEAVVARADELRASSAQYLAIGKNFTRWKTCYTILERMTDLEDIKEYITYYLEHWHRNNKFEKLALQKASYLERSNGN